MVHVLLHVHTFRPLGRHSPHLRPHHEFWRHLQASEQAAMSCLVNTRERRRCCVNADLSCRTETPGPTTQASVQRTPVEVTGEDARLLFTAAQLWAALPFDVYAQCLGADVLSEEVDALKQSRPKLGAFHLARGSHVNCMPLSRCCLTGHDACRTCSLM